MSVTQAEPEIIQLRIINRKGLHARAAAKFVKIAEDTNARIFVRKAATRKAPVSPWVPGSSILDLLMLAADKESIIEVKAEGDNVRDVLEALRNLVESRFEEEE